MNLKKLELFGFKSFMRKLDIHFSDGITVIVGPNGCGKTNVTDAVRWVLGEGNARALRGTKMEDLIFNGTRDYKPLNVAEVELTVDNSSRILPIDFTVEVKPYSLIRMRGQRLSRSAALVHDALIEARPGQRSRWTGEDRAEGREPGA